VQFNLSHLKLFKSLTSYIFFQSLVFLSVQAQVDTLYISPGKYLVIDGDTISIDKTSIDKTMEVLGIQEKPEFAITIADYVDLETGGFGSDVFKSAQINFEGISFEYEGPEENNMNLKWIRIPHSKKYIIEINSDIIFEQVNPEIDLHFPSKTTYDYVSEDSLTYNLYSYGLSFSLEEVDSNRILKEVSVHYTVKK
jgi:hypothetical protein